MCVSVCVCELSNHYITNFLRRWIKLAKCGWYLVWEHCVASFPCLCKMGISDLGIGKIGTSEMGYPTEIARSITIKMVPHTTEPKQNALTAATRHLSFLNQCFSSFYSNFCHSFITRIIQCCQRTDEISVKMWLNMKLIKVLPFMSSSHLKGVRTFFCRLVYFDTTFPFPVKDHLSNQKKSNL